MEEPGAPSSPDPREEVEMLRERLRRLETEHAEIQQKLFDQYEWTREKTKAFAEELQSLRSISLEYKILDFLRGIYQRTTGLPRTTLEEEVEKVKVSLVAVPEKGNPNTDEWLRSLLRQTHTNFDLTVVIGTSDTELSKDIRDSANVRIVRTDDNYSDAVRANVGLGYGSGDVWGVVVGGYWPYARSLENVARFFAAHRTCQVMLPLDVSVFNNNLIAPTEYPGQQDFMELWKKYTGGHGCFFFRPKAFKKIGRINYEAGDAWLFGTLLQLAWHFSIERPDRLVVVNATPASGPERRSRIESQNEWVRQHFYDFGFFNEYREPVWYFPLEHATAKLRDRRIRIERVYRHARGALFKVRRKLFSPHLPLHFPVNAEQQLGGLQGVRVDLSGIEACPLTERLPDRFLFSFATSGAGRVADTYYASETSLAIVNRERFCTGGSQEPEGEAASNQASSRNAGWRFIRPISFTGITASPSDVPEPKPEKLKHAAQLPAAYVTATATVLNTEKATDALWIGDPRFGPSDNSDVSYNERRIWDDYPALASVEFEALTRSNVLAGRSTEAGFDLIHLAGVIQFCRRPRHLLRFLAFALKFDSAILISTPNLDSSELRLVGPAWCHWEPDRTCFVYGAKSLRALMRHCGFEEKKLVTFSHPSWQLASRGNVANGLPMQSGSSELDIAAFGIQSQKAQALRGSPELEGDYLIGLFARKL
jgi:hypothetical protein